MKLWKSPVLYIGVLLLLAVIAALAAPFIVNWESYRADLEGYGYKLTGRDVTIAGPISVSLFPWPSFTAENVHIANPPGMSDPEFAEAARITARMQLSGLFSGSIQVESIEIAQPTITLERQPDGAGNWNFDAPADAAVSDILGRIKLDRISLVQANVRLIDRRRTPGLIELHLPAAILASPSLAGPWRMNADKVEAGNQNFALSVSTGTWRTGVPLQFSARVTGAGAPGLVWSFEGASEGDAVKGAFQVEPAATEDGGSDSAGQLQPMVFRSNVEATFDAVAFSVIELAPLDPKAGGAIASGSARLTLGNKIAARADLVAPRIDLEALAGAQAWQVLREGGQLGVVDALLAVLPEAVELSGSFKVGTLKAGGETLENLMLRGEASREVIRIRELSASLPGRSRALLQDAVFFPGKIGSEIAGKLAFESSDLRQFTLWLWPEFRENVAKIWSGSRGRLKLQTDLSLSASEFKLVHAQYEIDGLPGTIEFAAAMGGKGAIDLRITADKLDVDSFAPGGIAAASNGGQSGLAALLSYVAPHKDARDIRLTVQAGELRLNGMTASDVAVDLVSAANGLDLRTVEIGSVGGAKLEAVGLILDTGSGPDGTIDVTVNAEDPRGLLRLLGVTASGEKPTWTSALGATTLKGSVTVRTEASGPVTGFDISGKSGDFELAALGTMANAPVFRDMEINGSIDLKSARSKSLAALAGLYPLTDDKEPASLSLTASGSLAKGFLTELNISAYGTRLDFDGTAGAHGKFLPGDGKISLRSTDLQALLGAMGLPQASLPADSLVLDAVVKTDDTSLTLPDIDGHFGDMPLTGSLTRAADGSFAVRLAADSANLGDLLGAAFLNWNGAAPEPDAGFALALPLQLAGELRLDLATLKVHDGLSVAKALVVVTAAPGDIRFSLSSASEGPSLDLVARGQDGKRAFTGKIRLPFDLAQSLRLAGGAAVAEGSGWIELAFQAEGRSPGAVLSTARGEGAYGVKNLKLVGISPSEFAAKLAAAKDGADLNTAFDALRSTTTGLPGGDVKGTIVVAGGAMAFSPLNIKTPEADAVVNFSAEPATGSVEALVTLQLKEPEGLPEMKIIYAGPAAELGRNEDKTELATLLGTGIMTKGVEELERLQREEKRLAEELEKSRKEDEARLVAYYAQRDELRLRQRELKVHGEMRAAAAEQIRRKIENERQINIQINAAEIKQRQRELRVHRRMAKAAPKPAPVEVTPAPAPAVGPVLPFPIPPPP